MASRQGSIPKSSSHQSALPNLGYANTHSASLAQAEREIKLLQDENRVLQEELQDIRSMCKQLITEGGHENFDERRVNLLKSQVIQLERQMLLQSEALSSRSDTLLEVENAIGAISDCCRKYLSQQDRVGSITLSRQDLKMMVDTAESVRLKLYKNIENTSNENLQQPLLFMDRFVKHRPPNPATLMDICSGNLEHINLKHVAKLESKLAQVYKLLKTIEQSLESIAPKIPNTHSNSELPKMVYSRLGGQVCKATDALKDVTSALLELSLLVPAAPWPALQNPVFKEMTVDKVMASLPNFPKSKAAEGRHQVEALLKAMNYTCYMNKLESQCLKDEVRFHQDVYSVQMDYVDSLFSAIGEGYRDFEVNTQQLICQPLKDVLAAYDTLKITATEEALRQFLSVFRQNADDISAAIEKMGSAFAEKGTDEAIGSYGEDFKKSIDHLHSKCQQKRDTTAEKLCMAKHQHQEIDEYLQQQYNTQNGEKIMSARSESGSDIYHSSTREMDKKNASPPSNISSMSSASHDPHVDVTKLLTLENTEQEKKTIDNRPAWDNSPIKLVDRELVTHEHTECTCGVEYDQNHDTALAVDLQITTIDSLSHKGQQPSVDKAKPRRKTDNIVKPVRGIPQAKLMLKPKERHSPNIPDQAKLESDLGEGSPLPETAPPIHRAGSLTSLGGPDGAISDRDVLDPRADGSTDPRADGSMRNSRARERRADSLSKIIQQSGKHSLDPLIPSATFSSAALKNSFGRNIDDKPWK